MPFEVKKFQDAIVSWFKESARDLPWRKTSEPYKIWISEMMLQQTQVATVIPYYLRFLERFPNIEALAEASEDEVLKYWEGLGYYRRAKNLRLAAQLICRELDGRFPNSRDELLQIPGIGPYSAGAILSIAFRISTPALDGNLIRVYSRFYAIRDAVDSSATLKNLWEIARAHAPSEPECSREFAEGMMELGALICTPKNPKCPFCPLKKDCVGFETKIAETLPRKARKGERQVKYERVIYAMRQNKIGFLPKGSDPKFPDFLRLPYRSLKKAPQDSKKFRLFRYSFTHRNFRVYVERAKIPTRMKMIWLPKAELENILLPAIDRKIIRSFGG